MKRYYIYIAVSLLAFSSCMKDENDILSGNGSGSSEALMPITVSPSTGDLRQTKSKMIYDLDGIKNSGKHISLYSYANFGESSTFKSILENAKLKWDGSAWTYMPTQYWITSAESYHFSAIYPFMNGRLSPSLAYPTSADEYVLGLQPKVYPVYENWTAEDYAQGNIIYKYSKSLYLTNSMDDVMFGETSVSPSGYGKDVDITMKHAGSAVRFRVRNLSEAPFALTNWYMTGLKNHIDMIIDIIGCPEEYDPLRPMTIVPDSKIAEIDITNFGQSDKKDKVKFKDDSDWTICGDGGVTPGNENYYKYVILSSRLKEVGAKYNLSHTHSTDGLTITYYDGSGNSWTDPQTFMSESSVFKDALDKVKSLDSSVFHNSSNYIFWGPTHYLDADQFFIPLVYEYGAQILNFDSDASNTRGNQGDYDLKIHQFECRSHMFQSAGVWKANGGLYLPVSGDQYANLYSPYFFSAESHSTVTGDWKEGMGDDRWDEDDPNYNANDNGKQRSIFLWTATNDAPQDPLLLSTCIANYNEKNQEYTPSVTGGDLANILDDEGYILMFPQKLDNLEFHFFTDTDGSATGNPATATYASAPSHHSFNLKSYTPGGEWLSGYEYDYIITVSSSSISMQVDVAPWNERTINLD